MDPPPGLITVNEGKSQVRKMTAAVGFPPRLVRVRIGNVYSDAREVIEVENLQ
jgi:16S rRNA U516 pseudouridylate synthase RsuA-like enzyme